MAQYVEDYTDINVEGVEFYIKSEFDGFLYKEKACENRVNSEEMIHEFEMNDIVIVDGNYKCRPLCLGNTDEGVFVIYNKVTEVDNEMELVPTQVLAFDPELITDVEIGVSEDLLGKVVSDLQENIEISEGKITGTLKHVTGYTGFSSDPELQEGNYLAIHNISNLEDPIVVELIGGFSGPTTLDADGIIILRIANKEQKVKVTCGNLVNEYSLEYLELLSE